jgi:predicted RNA-binding Zn-ribbon protein involved in translation (DUF1610 family)
VSDESDTTDELVDYPCPYCSEARIDYLEWEDDDIIKCISCGRSYRPFETR